MKFNVGQIVRNLFNSKRFLVIFSIVCAVIFWLVIDITENPTREVTISGVPVAVVEQADDKDKVLKVIGEYRDEISVTVSGPGYIVSNVDADDITVAVVSYAEVNGPGKYTLDLKATVNVAGCTVEKLSHSYIQVVYDYDTSAEIPVDVDVTQFQTLLPADREIFKSVLRNNSDGLDLPTLKVTGPSEVIGVISKVVATPDIPNDAAPETQNFSGTLVFYDADGNVVDSTQLVYNTDHYIRVVVYKVAEVKLVPTFTNLPACYQGDNSSNLKYTLYRYNELARAKNPITVVKARGPVDVMDKIITSGLELTPIDFMKVTSGSTSFNVSFALSDGVEVVDGTEEVVVALQFGNLRTTTIVIEPSRLNFKGLSQGLSAVSSITNKQITVKVCYDRNKTARVTAEDIILSVDCSGVNNASSVTRPITVSTVSDKVFAWANSIDPAETGIEIK